MEKPEKIIKNVWKFLGDVFFPPVCVNCRLPISDQSKFLCQNCFDEIRLNSALYCPKCGARMADTDLPCHDSGYVLAPATGFFPPLPALIHHFKYRGLLKINLLLSGMLIAYLKKTELDLSGCRLTFIPLHPSKQRSRGFNQAELLVKTVADYFSLPLILTLIRTVNNQQQAKLKNFDQRVKNVFGCFRTINPENIAGRKIILVDDVSTSGATLAEASRILKKYGARKIIALVVAKA